MKNKFNQKLLNEELNKFKLLLEYDFYTEKKEAPTYKDDKELVLGGSLSEVDEVPDNSNNQDVNTNSGGEEIAGGDDMSDLGGDDMSDLGGDDMSDLGGEETTNDIPDIEEPPIEEPPIEEPSDEVEIDVTSLVKGSEEAKNSADKATQNTEILLNKLSDLESRLDNMTAISDKIENLEQEFIKRNPTPVEKLEMRSLSSYPFNQKLSDYWSEKEGAYDVMGKNKPKEYVLRKDDIDSTYSDATIKNSFNNNVNDFEEEDISDYYEENY